MCEYGHAMGNSFGAVHKYLELAYREPLFQGGFIWDFADQVIQRTDRYGRGYFGYGGDTGDAPNDLDFSGNGVWFVDRGATPKTQELKYLYQPIEVVISPSGFTVNNRHLFTGAGDYDCLASLSRDGRKLAERRLEIEVGPGESRAYPPAFAIPKGPGEYAVDISFRLRSATAWAEAGYEVAFGQAVCRAAWDTGTGQTGAGAGAGRAEAGRAGAGRAEAGRAEAPELVEGIHNFGVRGRHFMALFSRIHGGLVSYRFGFTPDGGHELLRGVPRPNFWHAPTSNEVGWQMPLRDGQWLLASRYARIRNDLPGGGGAGADPAAANPSAACLADRVEVRYGLELGGAPPSQCDMVYSVFADGRIELELTVRPGAGLGDMPEFGALLTASADLRRLRWYGDGPAETYVDRRRGARLGIYEADVADQLTAYLRPQEAGNHTGVRWAEVTDGRGNGLRFDCAGQAGGMEFSALPWTPFEIENAAHPVELPPIQQTVLRPALMRRGVGGDDSWGAEPHPEYRLPAGRELVFRFGFKGLRG
jgi:beta-galactosidase